MADKKRLLGSGSQQPMPLGMHCKPWYKDKLPSKCLAKHKVLKFPTSLDCRQWRFVKEGLDDFRKGCPPCEDVITSGPKKSFLPLIPQRVPLPPPPKSHKVLYKDTGLFSKLSPAQFERKKFMEDVEAHLNQHRLAMSLDVDEDVPAELLLKVLQVVDPDRRLEDTWAYCEGTRKRIKPPQKVFKTYPEKFHLEPPKKTPGTCPESLVREGKKPRKKGSRKRVPRSKVPERVRDFCKWVATFGDLGIDENFFMQLFDRSSECKHTHKTSRIKKVTQVPLELKYCKELDEEEQVNFSIEETNWERKLQEREDPYKPNRVKMRYGAWYLKPKLWKKLINNEPLIDPNIESSFGKPPTPDILEELYGTLAFKDYVLSKGYEMPSMIERLFARKGWTYDSVKTPMERSIRLYALKDDDEEEPEAGQSRKVK
ncbi:protein FAM47A-like [Talpa occidentalis]|uniref:protein FAM47A-like n=1 Tax=Talpa occidentalis TaxID=50954 RepID=UPI00188E7257|nr:protein FAM47A-like [Talpa occidentalis]